MSRYKVTANLTVFTDDLTEARLIGQSIKKQAGENRTLGGVQLEEFTNGRAVSVPLYKPEAVRGFIGRQDSFQRVEKIIKALNVRYDLTLDLNLADEVIVLETSNSYGIDYRKLYSVFTEQVGEGEGAGFKEVIAGVLTTESLRGIKGIPV